MSWGKWIITSFVLFALFIAVLVTVSIRQDVNLVSKDYYQEELIYQRQIERIKNTEALSIKPEITFENDRFIQIQYIGLKRISKGELILFRPSDAGLDQKFIFQSVSDSTLSFELKPAPKGMYRAKMSWTMDGREYYLEEVITI